MKPNRTCSLLTAPICAKPLAIILLAGLPVVTFSNEVAVDDDIVNFNIPAQAVPDALNDYARQASVQLLFISNGFENILANAVIGSFPREEALRRLLAGTGLEARLSADGGVKVKPTTTRTGSALIESNAPRLASADRSINAADDQNPEQRQRPLISKEGVETATKSRTQDVKPDAIEEILVTGTNIKGVGAVGADIIRLDREYIELSGIATTTELIQSIPQNFGLGNEAVEAVGVVDTPGFNLGFSSSIDLRGLGADSTLVLLNGRRSPGGGNSANLVDLNHIPTTAIARIEILADGASAIYGSDAIGGVVNVILRQDYEGAETSVRYAPGTSEIEEVRISQVLGRKWNTGNFLFSYELYDRSELEAADREYTRDSDLTSLGGGNHSIPESNPGNILDPNTFQPAFAIPPGQDGRNLSVSDLIDLSENPEAINLQNTRAGSDILPDQTRHSLFLSARQKLFNSVDVFAEGRYSTREFELFNRSFGDFLVVPSTNPFFIDPFGGSENLFVLYNTVADYGPSRSTGELDAFGGVLGAVFTLNDSWDLEISGSYGVEDTTQRNDRQPNFVLLAAALADSDPATAFNPFGDGSNTNPATLSAIEGFFEDRVESTLATIDLLAEGDLFDLLGGTAKLAIGGQFRDQSLESDQTAFLFTTQPEPGGAGAIFDLDREVKAAFAEVYLPLVTEQNGRPGIHRLAISLAGRVEDYSDFGDTVDPKLGVEWSPLRSVQLRGTVGTSFRAPLLTELDESNSFFRVFNVPDPASPTGSSPALVLIGNSPDVGPEEGVTWTAGISVQPPAMQGFAMELTYFETEVDDVIQRPANTLSAVFLDPSVASVVTFCPCDTATLSELFNDPRFLGAPVPLDQVAAIADFRIQNVAKAELAGLDLSLSYVRETALGTFNASLYASRLFDFKEQLVNGPLVDNSDRIAKPNSLKLRSSLSWSAGGFRAAVAGNHIGDYTDDLGSLECSTTPCAVASWTTWDVQLGYDFTDRFARMLDGTRLSVTVRNAFDRDPPFVDIGSDGVGFDAINAHPLGRFAVFELTKSW